MTAQPMEQQTYLPQPDEAEEVAELLSFLEAHETARGVRPEPRYFLAGAGEGEHVEMPAAAHAVLLQVLQAMKAGKAVTVAPHSTLLTTQQAADLLGVSRPTVVKLITDGLLPCEIMGKSRRMVKLDDLLRYREHRRDQQYAALMATAADYDDLEDRKVLQERLRRARAEAAARRRAANA